MKVDVVVDVGNTSVKLARCMSEGFGPKIRLPHSIDQWNGLLSLDGDIRRMAIGGVVPHVINDISTWAKSHGVDPILLTHAAQIPMRVNAPNPASVGVDRLFDSLAASRRFPNRSLLLVDSGTAITINAVSVSGMFEGGAILPGLALMAKSLNEYTALLPIVQIDGKLEFPGKDTKTNIKTGILGAALGAIERCSQLYCPDIIIFTGTDGTLLHQFISFPSKELIPTLTIEGIRIAAEALP